MGNGPFVLGWSFQVLNPITVTALAVYENNGAGIAEEHDVGIWNSAGTLVEGTFVEPGDPNVFDQLGQQEWVTFANSPTTLYPGTYTIGAVWLDGTDALIFPGTPGLNVNGPSIRFIQNEYAVGTDLNTEPTNTTGDLNSYFGPNFTYVPATVPEPGTLLLLGSGLLGAVGVMRRKLNM